MPIYKLSLFMAALCALSACAKVNTYNANSAGNVIQRGSGLARVDVSTTTLQGNWKTRCTSPSKESHYTTAISFQNDVMTTITDSFADPDCKFIIDEETRYSRFTQDTTSDNLARITDTLTLLQYTPKNEATTTIFNRTKFCGVTSWSTGAQVSFTDGTKCGVKATLEYHAEIYGAQELYLDDCGSADSNCSSIRYLKVVNP